LLTQNLIPPSKELGYKDIFLDFLAGKNPPKDFYLSDNLETVAAQLDRVDYDRGKMAAILTRQNRAFGVSDKTLANIERLKDPRAVCVLTGQQAGFLGGPLFSVVKMLGIVKSARLYEKKLNRPVIPIFWIAGDDHDFEEVNHLFILNRQSEPCEISYTTLPEIELPTAEIFFSDKNELEGALNLARECLGESDFTQELFRLIEHSYTSDDTFVTAFGKFMAGLMGDFGLVMFSPGDLEVKRHAIGFFEQILDKQESLHDAVLIANERIINAGYHIQVEKKENATHIFYNLNGRKPVMREGEKFTCGEKIATREEMLECFYESPEKFSPDVMTRPVFQSFLLFELFDLVPPVHHARPTFTVLEKRFEKQMLDYDISFEELTGDIEQVINRIMAASFPDELENEFKLLKDDVEKRFNDFSQKSLEFDPSLKNFAKQIYGKIDFNLKAFEGKVFSSHKKKSQETRDRIYRLWKAVYPNRDLQERSMNITYFIARYGCGIIPFLYDKMDSEEKSHQIIKLSEFVE